MTVKVSDEHGGSIAGSLVLIARGTWAWRAAVQPVPGRYIIEVIDHLGFGEGLDLEIVPAAERTWPELTSAASLSQVTIHEAPACCTLDTGDGVIDFNCRTLSEMTYAVLQPGLSSSSFAGAIAEPLRYAARRVGG